MPNSLLIKLTPEAACRCVKNFADSASDEDQKYALTIFDGLPEDLKLAILRSPGGPITGIAKAKADEDEAPGTAMPETALDEVNPPHAVSPTAVQMLSWLAKGLEVLAGHLLAGQTMSGGDMMNVSGDSLMYSMGAEKPNPSAALQQRVDSALKRLVSEQDFSECVFMAARRLEMLGHKTYGPGDITQVLRAFQYPDETGSLAKNVASNLSLKANHRYWKRVERIAPSASSKPGRATYDYALSDEALRRTDAALPPETTNSAAA